ncbi:MAG: diguanylate cyclase/phosphodiesterase with sensor(s) [Bryobacterales bacterium]|nr:diguanylate cyclase/phosphodiesterase with sensor(s) [Bryobacterales bacterium]
MQQKGSGAGLSRQAEVILLALDLNGRIALVNRNACGVLAWASEEMLGRDWIETAVPLPMRGEARKRLGKLFARKPPEFRVLTKSGGERLIEWRNTLQRDHEGRVIGALSSGTDITARRQADIDKVAAMERLSLATAIAKVGAWGWDLASDKVLQFRMLPGHDQAASTLIDGR